MTHDYTKQVLCLNPLVVVYDNFFDQKLADKIIEIGKPGLRPGEVINHEEGGLKTDEYRTNEASGIDPWADEDITDLVVRIASLVRLPPENSESGQFLSYRGEQEFKTHPDAFQSTKGTIKHLAMGGQRLFTTICYLNDLDEGGETDFPQLKIKVKPKLGRILLFSNTRLGTTEPHPHSWHAGRSVGDQVKYALTFAWRQNVFYKQRDYPARGGEYQIT